MLKVISVVHKLIWIAADTKKLKIHFILNYLFGVIQGLLLFFFPLVLSEMVNSITDRGQYVLYWFYALVFLAAVTVLSKFVVRYYLEYLTRI